MIAVILYTINIAHNIDIGIIIKRYIYFDYIYFYYFFFYG